MARFDGAVSELEKSVKRLNDGEQAKTRVKWIKNRKRIL